MVRIVNPAKPDGPEFTKSEVLQVYNSLDTLITREVFDEISPQLTPNTQKIYDFSRALQAPVLDMCLRGVRVDEAARKSLLTYYLGKVKHYTGFLDTMAHAVWDKPLNPDSPAQLQFFFYRVMGYPVIKSRKGREMKVSTDRAALEQLSLQHIYARPIIQIILALRDAKGSVETLLRGIDDDGRYRAAYNIAGTVTGRWSSSKNIFGRGGNLQNVTDKLRRMFVADPGMRMAYIDLEQAESRAVGFICKTIFGRDTYLKACGSGDLHSTVCTLNWPELPWTGDLAKDRKVAESPFYREMSYRDAAKRLGHGCLTGDHEVLTRDGWIEISKVKDGVEILAWDYYKETAKWETPTAWTRKSWEGALYSIEGQQMSMLASSDHRMPIVTHRGAKSETSAESVFNFARRSFPTTCQYTGGTTKITENQARLCAAVQADGHILKDGSIQFGFRKSRKVLRLKELLGTREYHGNFNCRGDYFFRIPARAVDFPCKKKAGVYLMEWPLEALKAYTDEHIHWDGTTQQDTPGTRKFKQVYGKDREHMFWLFTVGRLTGQSMSYAEQKGYKTAAVRYNNRPMVTIGHLEIKQEPGNGRMVYCPTLPSGGFVTRRNNKLMLSLNSNYGGSPGVMALHTKTEKAIIEEFQNKYFTAFPELQMYHRWIAEELKRTGTLTNPFGRERRFFGRSDDHKVINEAVAYLPQSLVADMLNNGLLEVYRLHANKKMPVYLLAQVHDAIIVQYPIEAEDEVISACLACLESPLAGTDFWIPSDVQVGYNWAKATKPWKEGTKAKPGDKFHIPEIGFLFQAKEPTETRPDPSNKIWKMLEEQSNPRGISGYKRTKAA